MKHDKQHYCNLPLAKEYGFSWIYFEDGLHAFQKQITIVPAIPQDQLDDGWKPVPQIAYNVVRCFESEIDDGRLRLMFEKWFTR